MEDTFKHKGLRRMLAKKLKKKGIHNQTILNAIEKIPRHLFMEAGFVEFAYKDQAFRIGAGQTISQPYTVAFQTELLDISPGDKVLEIGTGSGYQTAVLLELKASVYTIERQRELYLKAQKNLQQLGYYPHFYYGDGYKGKEVYAPYDKILITAAAPYISNELKQQLKIGGTLVAPIGAGDSQTMTTLVKVSETEFAQTDFGDFSFVPMLKGIER